MMTHKFLVTPRLNQAFETAPSGGGFASNEITRRTFLKRTGGATVASLVAWNLASQQAARADGGPGSASASMRMCAISPQTRLEDIIGYVSLPPFPNGGYVVLYYVDSACHFHEDGNHAAFHIKSEINIWAEAWIPAKQNQNPSAPWLLRLPRGNKEINRFVFDESTIVRQNFNEMELGQYSINLDGDLPAGSRLDLKLQVLSVVRTDSSVTVEAKAWLEGTAGGVTYDSAFCADGYGISLVVRNDQQHHDQSECQCAI